MSRSHYSDDCDNLNLYRGTVRRTIRSKRGQAFLRELAAAMDSMPVKELIADELIDDEGRCCTIGVVCKARGIDVRKIDCRDPEDVGDAVGIARQMAAEIEYFNDEETKFREWDTVAKKYIEESPANRWTRMRKKVDQWLNGITD